MLADGEQLRHPAGEDRVHLLRVGGPAQFMTGGSAANLAEFRGSVSK